LAAARSHRIPVLEEPRTGPQAASGRSAFIEGPDRMVIDLIEDHSERPPITD
jgi:hypothetical protein